MNTLRVLLCLVAVALVAALSGCSYGGGGAAGPDVVVDFYVRMAGPINPAFYYFIPIDADGDFGADGPLPVAAGPYWENGWGTGSFTHYIAYHAGRYDVYRTNSQVQLTTAGGGITAISGVPTATAIGTSVLTVQTLAFGAEAAHAVGVKT